MTLKLYHAEPVANSLKSLIPLHEKGLTFESVYVDLHRFEQHQPWFIALNPEGQVPVLDHDGVVVTHSTVINEYLEDAFPDAPPLRPSDAAGRARMRYWNKFVDEHVMNFVSMWGWHRMVGVIARSVESGAFGLQRRGPRQRHTQNRGCRRQGRAAAWQQHMAGGRLLYARGRQFLQPLRNDARADVPRDRQPPELPSRARLGGSDACPAGRGEGSRGPG